MCGKFVPSLVLRKKKMRLSRIFQIASTFKMNHLAIYLKNKATTCFCAVHYLCKMDQLQKKLIDNLTERREVQLLRQLPPSLEGWTDFCSNDYLGYARMPMEQPHTARVGGATGSRLISGNSKLAEELEDQLAHFHQAEAALLFGSGYAANIGLLSAVVGRKDTIVYDKLLHASLRDGIILTRARALGFAHNDLNDLQQKLQAASGTVFVVVESIYSMDGDVAPIVEIAQLCQAAGAALIVDEAHSTGILGPQGEGLVVAEGLQEYVFARVHTFGKAIGSHGAVVAGSQVLKDYLINFARSFIYSTALPSHTLASIQQVYQQLAVGDELAQLRSHIRFFLDYCPPALCRRLVPSTSPIQALMCPGNVAVTALAQSLQEQNMAVLPIRYPTVPAGQERLRICLHSFNTEQEIRDLIHLLLAAQH
jgi:8-amino-7-oxononanoate synthase